MTTAYEVQGTVVNTLKEVAELLGEAKVTGKDIKAGKYDGVTIVTADTDSVEDSIKDTIVEKSGIPADNLEVIYVTDSKKELVTELVEPTQGAMDAITKAHQDHKALTNTDEVDESTDTVDEPGDNQLEYPEVGAFENEKAIKKYIKGLTNEQLTEWVELEGVEYKANDHESINRMRQAMAIKGLHFPETIATKGSSKKKSKYGDYSTEQLVEMALENDVEVRDDKGDPRILRMYTIMALKEAGLLEA